MGSKAGRGSNFGAGKFEHTRAVADALDVFQQALGDRYLEVMYNHYPNIEGPAHLEGATPELWDYTSELAKAHLDSGFCKFLYWFADGGRGDGFRDVVCDSYLPGEMSGKSGAAGFTCGMGQMFAAAIEWAWKDREYIFGRIPPFAAQNINAIRTTHDAYLNAAEAFGMDYPGVGGWGLEGVSGSLKDVVEDIAVRGKGDHPDWMVDWTGAAAEGAAYGFFNTIEPTLNNHAKIADALGYLVNLRATIIDRNRINTLDLIDSATAALGETRDVDLKGRWAVVQGMGSAISLTIVGAPIGGPLTFVGWLGEKLYPVKKDAAYASEPHEVAAGLADAFDSMARDIEYAEADYRNEAGQVENEVGGAPLEVLELYDLTRNEPEGANGASGEYTVNIDEITNLARKCYGIGEAYEEVRMRLRDLYDADPYLTDQNGDPTEGDTKVLAMREDLVNFVSTTIGRYSLMGSQLEEAARGYAESDDSAAEDFADWEETMDESNEGPPVSPGEAEAFAEATDRNSTGPKDESADEIAYDPPGDHPEPPEPEKQEG